MSGQRSQTNSRRRASLLVFFVVLRLSSKAAQGWRKVHSILNYGIEIYGRVSGWTAHFPAEHLLALHILLASLPAYVNDSFHVTAARNTSVRAHAPPLLYEIQTFEAGSIIKTYRN